MRRAPRIQTDLSKLTDPVQRLIVRHEATVEARGWDGMPLIHLVTGTGAPESMRLVHVDVPYASWDVVKGDPLQILSGFVRSWEDAPVLPPYWPCTPGVQGPAHLPVWLRADVAPLPLPVLGVVITVEGWGLYGEAAVIEREKDRTAPHRQRVLFQDRPDRVEGRLLLARFTDGRVVSMTRPRDRYPVMVDVPFPVGADPREHDAGGGAEVVGLAAFLAAVRGVYDQLGLP